MLSPKLAVLISLFLLLSNCSSIEGQEIDKSDAEQSCKAHIAAGVETRSEEQCISDTFAINQMIRHTFPAVATRRQMIPSVDDPNPTAIVQSDPPANPTSTTWQLPAAPTRPTAARLQGDIIAGWDN